MIHIAAAVAAGTPLIAQKGALGGAGTPEGTAFNQEKAHRHQHEEKGQECDRDECRGRDIKIVPKINIAYLITKKTRDGLRLSPTEACCTPDYRRVTIVFRLNPFCYIWKMRKVVRREFTISPLIK